MLRCIFHTEAGSANFAFQIIILVHLISSQTYPEKTFVLTQIIVVFNWEECHYLKIIYSKDM